MLRGINRQQVFLEPRDYELFFEILKTCKAICGFQLYACCLMGNHVHLLIKAEEEDIGQVMKRIGILFVQSINQKYGRSGHLFQDRYKSEAVEDDTYFLTLIRYIHQNLVKAGLTATVADYPYSSYPAYCKTGEDDLIDCSKLWALIGRSQFEELMQVSVVGYFMNMPDKRPSLPDLEAISLIKKIARVQECNEVLQLKQTAMDKAIAQLLQKGVSVRQLSRLTGIPRGHVDSINRRKRGWEN